MSTPDEAARPLQRGDFVTLTVDGRSVRAFVALASPCGASLMVLFEAVLDGCAGAMPLLGEPRISGDGVAPTLNYRNVITGRPIDVVRS